ncbi:RNA recognition motif domain [Macleaya cordata]|uniref:RNA recognition motif domain n=1 Tax=Macleaya cordata TaxID=56857 RepID=A0A200PZ84_MACCD|nr:RNA recognition motif domain [Macleaya cordata]
MYSKIQKFGTSRMKSLLTLNRFLLGRRRFSTQLFVSRLSSYTTDEELKALFSPFGEVTKARLIKDGRTQRPKGFGFVTYESDLDAQTALKAMDGRYVLEKQIVFFIF